MNEIDSSLSEFVSLYNDEMSRLINVLEPERKRYHQLFMFSTRLSVLLSAFRWFMLICVLYFAVINKPSYMLSAVFLVFLLTVFIGLCDAKTAKTKIDYKKNIKKAFYSKLFEILDGFGYEFADIQKILNLSDRLQKLNIFGSFTNLFCDDCIYYKDDKLNLEIYDVAAATQIVGYKTRIKTSNFEGILVIAPCFKSFKGTTIIKPKTNVKAFADVLTSFERVNLEDSVFESIFDVYSTSQIEARYLITTAFMERLIKFVKEENKHIICSFEDNQVYIGIKDAKDWFEIPIDKPLKDIKNISSFFEELNVIIGLVSTLKLENKIGL